MPILIRSYWLTIATTAALFVLLEPSTASATAMVNVRAFYGLELIVSTDDVEQGVLPQGVTLTCVGDGGPIFFGIGCEDETALIGSNDRPGLVQIDIHHETDMVITNNTDQIFSDGLTFLFDETSVEHDGLASVTDPVNEYANFSSHVLGNGFFEDFHACDTRPAFNPDGEGVNYGDGTCGVSGGGDDEEGVAFIAIPDPGESATFTFTTDMSAQLFVAPEPASLALFGVGLVGAGAMWRRRKKPVFN